MSIYSQQKETQKKKKNFCGLRKSCKSIKDKQRERGDLPGDWRPLQLGLLIVYANDFSIYLTWGPHFPLPLLLPPFPAASSACTWLCFLGSNFQLKVMKINEMMSMGMRMKMMLCTTLSLTSCCADNFDKCRPHLPAPPSPFSLCQPCPPSLWLPNSATGAAKPLSELALYLRN